MRTSKAIREEQTVMCVTVTVTVHWHIGMMHRNTGKEIKFAIGRRKDYQSVAQAARKTRKSIKSTAQ
jgi:hypothetical protein